MQFELKKKKKDVGRERNEIGGTGIFSAHSAHTEIDINRLRVLSARDSPDL